LESFVKSIVSSIAGAVTQALASILEHGFVDFQAYPKNREFPDYKRQVGGYFKNPDKGLLKKLKIEKILIPIRYRSADFFIGI